MSLVSNRHSVVPFVAGKTVPLTGQRLAKVGYKKSKKQEQKYKSIAVSVPALVPVSDQFNQYAGEGRFDKIVVAALENAQDGIIRSLYESSQGALQSVSDDDISIDACLAYIESEQSGGRLTKELIESWFDSEVSENLAVMIAEKLGTEDYESDAVQKHVKVYRQILSMLAGGATILAPEQIKGCRKAISLCANDSTISGKLANRLDQMEKPQAITDLLEL